MDLYGKGKYIRLCERTGKQEGSGREGGGMDKESTGRKDWNWGQLKVNVETYFSGNSEKPMKVTQANTPSSGEIQRLNCPFSVTRQGF